MANSKDEDVLDIVLGENDYSIALARHPYRNSKMDELVVRKKMPDDRASLAMELIRAWGMVAAKTGTEDSVGRARLTLMDVNEVVDRAISMTERAFIEMEGRGWVYPLDRARLEPDKPAGDPS